MRRYISTTRPWRLPRSVIRACFIIVALTMALPGVWRPGPFAGENPHLYSTGRIMEADRCASAWLIKRFVDPDAEFVFFKDGKLIPRGTAFDTPDARFSRTHNRATFEVLVAYYKIEDPGVAALAEAIHEIEINYWAGNRTGIAAELAQRINAIIKKYPEPAQCLEKSFECFDRFVNRLSAQ